jgi:hypothetical protein
MPATDVEIVFSLAKKGFDLHIASHFERALDKWRAALAAAEALGADDCIMVAMIKTHIALELFALENAPFAPLTQDFVLSIVKTFGRERRYSAAAPRRRHAAAGQVPAQRGAPVSRADEGRYAHCIICS